SFGVPGVAGCFGRDERRAFLAQVRGKAQYAGSAVSPAVDEDDGAGGLARLTAGTGTDFWLMDVAHSLIVRPAGPACKFQAPMSKSTPGRRVTRRQPLTELLR